MRNKMVFGIKFLPVLLSFLLLPSAVFAQPKQEKAVFAGGCFWCMTPPFEELDGVISVISGYTAGTSVNPTYKDYDKNGHIEAVEITFDPAKISFDELLNVYWRQVNPTDSGGQFCDRGPAYRPVIFFLNEEQKNQSEASKTKLDQSRVYDKPVTTEILSAKTFYPAEEYHQDYHKKNPVKYKFYRFKCGRDQFLEKIWGKSDGH